MSSPSWIDSDAHIFETVDLWDRLPAEYRKRVTLTPMSENAELRRFSTGCDTALDGHYIPIVYNGSRADRYERLIPQFLEKYSARAGNVPEQYLADMNTEGMDRVVIYPTLFLWAAWMPQLEAPFSAALARAYNDWIYDFVSIDRRRMNPAAVLSVHDVDLAIAEAKRIADRGFVAVLMRPNPMFGRTIGSSAYHKLYAVLEDLGLTVGIHEGQLSYMPTLGLDRTQKQWALHCMTHPFEQMAAMTSLLEHDVFDKFPKLHFLFLEAGTPLWLPYWLNRLDSELKTYRRSLKAGALLPSELFARQGWVTAEVDDPHLAATLQCISHKKLLFSTDYPHQESPFPHSLAEFAKQPISDEAKRAMGHDNAYDAYPRLKK